MPGDAIDQLDNHLDHNSPENVVCGHSLRDCEHRHEACVKHGGNKGPCADYARKCLDTCP